MPRLITWTTVLWAGVAHAQEPPPAPAEAAGEPAVEPAPTATTTPDPAPATPPAAEPIGLLDDDDRLPSERPRDPGEQSVGASVGIAAGGRVTAGGLRIAGHYLYQLSDNDWFDGIASFTFGGGDAECFRDRMNTAVCDHDFADGAAVEIIASVRRMLSPQRDFRPFARLGVGLAFVRFSEDQVSGFAVPLHAGAGVRVRVASGVAVAVMADGVLGLGGFSDGLGFEPQVGLAITAGAELNLP